MNADKPSKKIRKIKLKKRVEDLNLPARNKMRAAAVKYDPKKDRAPKILSIGKGAVAEKILELAEQHHIPIHEDKALAELLSKLEIDSEIPGQLYTVVAEILAFVYQLDRLSKKRNSPSASGKQKK